MNTNSTAIPIYLNAKKWTTERQSHRSILLKQRFSCGEVKIQLFVLLLLPLVLYILTYHTLTPALPHSIFFTSGCSANIRLSVMFLIVVIILVGLYSSVLYTSQCTWSPSAPTSRNLIQPYRSSIPAYICRIPLPRALRLQGGGISWGWQKWYMRFDTLCAECMYPPSSSIWHRLSP